MWVGVRWLSGILGDLRINCFEVVEKNSVKHVLGILSINRLESMIAWIAGIENSMYSVGGCYLR